MGTRGLVGIRVALLAEKAEVTLDLATGITDEQVPLPHQIPQTRLLLQGWSVGWWLVV